MFELQNQRVHLTYKTHLTDAQLEEIQQRVAKWTVAQWSMCHENGHTDMQYEHTHVFIRTKEKIKTKSQTFFDLLGPGPNDRIHPNIKPVASVTHERNILKYHHKEGIKCVQEPHYVENISEVTRRLFNENDLFEVAEKLNIQVRTIGDAKALMDSTRKRPAAEITYTLDQFKHKIPHIETVFVHGKAGTGKTQWAKAHFTSPLLVGTIDTLKQFNPEIHDGIVFDDMTFKHWPRESIIQLLDWDEDRDVHCRFQNAFIPKHTKKIFCSNKDLNETFGPYEFDQAITRRINAIYEIENDLRVNPPEEAVREPRMEKL